MDGSVFEEKSCFMMLGFSFFSKLDWGFYIRSIPKTTSKKIGALVCSMKFLSPEVTLCLYKSTICFAWNTIVMFGLALLAATWKCYISYKNGYRGVLVLHVLPLLNPWLINEM